MNAELAKPIRSELVYSEMALDRGEIFRDARGL
jgi:hypothetical protein